MSEIPDKVVEAVAQKINESRGLGGAYALELAREVIEYVEQEWPHNPPGHDYASTIASHEQLATQRDGFKYFGFGRGPSVVKA